MDANSDLKSDLQELQFDLSSKFYSTNSYTDLQSTTPQRKLSGYQEEKLISKPILSLTDFDKLNDQQYAMQLQFCHEKLLRNFLGDVIGGELAKFLILNTLAIDETDSFVILNNMLKVGYLVQVEGLNRISPGTSALDPTIQFNERNVYRINKNKESAIRSTHDIKFTTITDISAEQLPGDILLVSQYLTDNVTLSLYQQILKKPIIILTNGFRKIMQKRETMTHIYLSLLVN